jgi:copper(I)-binding protein
MNRRFRMAFGAPRTVRPMLMAVLIGAAAASAAAHDKRQGDLHIGHSWTKPAPAGGTVEVYFPLINRGQQVDRLVGATAAVAGRAGLAEMTGETVAVRAAIDLAPGRPVPLRPGRLHVRLEGLRQDLREGQEFPLTLRFAVSPPVEIVVLVEAAAGH